MPALYTVAGGGLIGSADIDQLVNTLNGSQNTPVFIKNTDPISFTLQLQNTDPASKALLVTAADGSTVLLRAQQSGAIASPDGTPAAPIVTTSHAQTLTNKTLSSPIINTGGLQVTVGNIGVGGAPTSNNGVVVPAGYVINAVSGGAAGVSMQGTLTAQANNDALYGAYVNPVFNDNAHTGVLHYGVYSASGSNFLAGNTYVGGVGSVQRLYTRGATADSSTDAFLAQNSAGTALFEVRDDGFVFFANGSRSIDSSGSLRAFYLTTTDGSNGIVQAGNGSLYVRSSGGGNQIVMDTGSGGLNVTAGGITAASTIQASAGGIYAPAGWVAAGPVISAGGGDLNANRNNGTGYVFLANGSHYIGFDGANYQLPTSGLNVGGGITALSYSGGPVTGSSLTATSGGGSITGTLVVNTVNVNSGGLNVSAGPFSANAGGASAVIAGHPIVASQANSTDWKFDSGAIFLNAIPAGQSSVSGNFNAVYSAAPNVVACLAGFSGSIAQLHQFIIAIHPSSVNTNGFTVDIDNQSGSTQTAFANWFAFGH